MAYPIRLLSWLTKTMSSRAMPLSAEKIRKLIARPRKRATIRRAIHHQDRIKFHTDIQSGAYLSAPLAEFLRYVESLLPPDKFSTFKELLRFPLATNNITAICFEKLSKIFDGRNLAFNYQFSSTELNDDWEWYRQTHLHEPNVWRGTAWEWFKTDCNSIIVCDLPREQDPTDRYPEPYFYFLRIEDVIDFKAHENGEMEYLIFKQKGDRIAVIDDESYRVYTTDKGNLGRLLQNAPHDLGYCPARFFVSAPLSLSDPDVKKSPLSKELAKLDEFLFKDTSKQHLDLYGSYPIYWAFEQDCDYQDEQGNYCSHGYLKDKNGYNIMLNGLPQECPKCSRHKLTGAGTLLQVPIPSETEGQPDLRDPVGIKTVDKKSLDWNVEEVKRLKDEIITSVVGLDTNLLNETAVNESQVNAQFESQGTILKDVKITFETAQKFVDDTCCRLRYGADRYFGCSISYGTDFFTQTVETLSKLYKQRKEAGASVAELDALRKSIIETEHKTNPIELQRAIILNDVEPLRLQSLKEARELLSDGVIDPVTFMAKLNFASYIDRFERENMNVIEFASAIPYERKVRILTDKIRDYAKTDIQSGQAAGGQSA